MHEKRLYKSHYLLQLKSILKMYFNKKTLKSISCQGNDLKLFKYRDKSFIFICSTMW